MKPKIVVIGSSNTDMVIKVPHLPGAGETVLGGEFHVINGGKGANQAIAAARAGGEVVFLASIGNDSFGSKSLEILKKEGIDISRIRIQEQEPSGVAMINVSDSGENSISVAPGANSYLLPEDIEEAESVIRAADIVLMQLEIPLETVYTSIRIAHESHIPVILNPAPARKLDFEMLKLVSVITPNKNEMAVIASSKNDRTGYEEFIEELKGKGLNTIIVTMGEEGVIFSSNGQIKHQAGNKVEAVDTTAAGDTFNGYLAVSLAEGKPMEEAVRMANRAASISVTRLGASTSIPYLKEIVDL
jgi:ribokinase